MPLTTPASTADALELVPLLKRHWGFDAFLPNQQEAISAVMSGQDSLVILPTGGGKSMCYQLPALALPGTALVISPLLALMKDQVDALNANGIPAASLNSAMGASEKRQVFSDLNAGRLKLLYLSPERLGAPDAQELIASIPVSFIAVDEAHCVSQWGHEFRPDYRNLARLRAWCPDVGMHALTATATPLVREDIKEALALREPCEVVGSYDRPNLLYRTVFRRDLLGQVREVLARHPDEAGILYCIRRADVDTLCASLRALGYKALPYHAGLSTEERKANQEAFVREEVDLIVATVAFGMGIDRSNVRFVLHTGMPKAIEHYQQEAGRAGRDRLPAECVLFYGAADLMAWRTIQGTPQNAYDQAAQDKLNEMYRFCRTLTCRHRFLVSYFGQQLGNEPCGACDVCLGEHAVMDDSLVVAQKILSAVARVQERFGARHVAEVLKGSKSAKILQNGHDRLSTYGLLESYPIADITDWIDQLLGQGFVRREGEYHVLKLNPSAKELLRGEAEVMLSMPQAVEPKKKAASREERPLSPQEEEIFNALRGWRRDAARDRRIAPYMVLGDASLRELAALRPTNRASLKGIKGIGESKARDYGDRLLEILSEEAGKRGLSMGEIAPLTAMSREPLTREPAAKPNATRQAAFAAFSERRSLEEAARLTGRAVSTMEAYLLEYLREHGVTESEPWVSAERYAKIVHAARTEEVTRLSALYQALGEEIPYGELRIALAVLGNRAQEAP